MHPAPLLRRLVLLAVFFPLVSLARAEDGYRLWLRYDMVADPALRADYAQLLGKITFSSPSGKESPTVAAARTELTNGIQGMLGMSPDIQLERSHDRADSIGEEGYNLQSSPKGHGMVIGANSDIGLLYGTFALLRLVQTRQSVASLNLSDAPKIHHRLLNHWDNLTGTIERGYAGSSLWNWFTLPDYLEPRYTDYARACASLGINGTCLNNVNANAIILTREYLEKVAALAGVFRPFGIKIYLSVRFSAPKEIGGLDSADPLAPAVQAWWREKVAEIYRLIPDFGGFLVKANSEGQPGPQDYGRTHADGANMLADALAPHGGVVMWRAFVYSHEVPDDRAKQAFNEFTPLDGQFRPNAFVQVKNGPIDFMPREPFHPLFGAMPRTPLDLELQITQEYLGASTQVAFLAPMWKETLNSDTFSKGPGSTVARVIDGTLDHHADSAIAGVANTGNSRNWTGHPFAAANWFAFGRLAWNHDLSSRQIAEEWTRMTFSNDPAFVQPVVDILLRSHETVVNYSMPLGLHHIMAEGHHYGPGPWVAGLARADWTAVYYHHASVDGIGFDRTATGSNAIAQYHAEVAKKFGDVTQCPENLLLWFHHLPWGYKLKSGRTLWDELCLHYQTGVNDVRSWITTWQSLERYVDSERFQQVAALLGRQERDARFWRDACLLYFQTFSNRPFPPVVEPAEHDLDYYRNFKLHYVPGHPGDMK